MRSKTLSSDLTILKKDLTRFAPVWLSLCAWLVIWGISIKSEPQSYSGSNFYEPIAPIFAPILAIVVFGYLSDPRECHVVHSLPLRRERLFMVHTIAACLMFLVPTALFCAVTGESATQGAMYRFLFIALEFLFLFSIGVLCVMLTGRKIGAGLLYLFIQCLSFIVGVLVQNLYLPLLPGVYLAGDYFLMSPMLLVGGYADFIHSTPLSPGDWAFLAVFFLISAAILAVSLILYRRRKLEHAGDLLAVSWLDPFFAVCSGVTGASAMILFDYEMDPFVLLLGCVIGYFAYWMLSKKTARVFTPKLVVGLVCLIAALVGSIYLVHLDPLDRVYYVPEPSQVKTISLGQGYYEAEDFTSDDQAVIEDISKLHLELAEHHVSHSLELNDSIDRRRIFISYDLENGRSIHREYDCADEALLDQAAWYLSQPIAVFGAESPSFSTIEVHYRGDAVYLDPRLLTELSGIVLTECHEGRMFEFGYSDGLWRLTFVQRETNWHTYLTIPDSAVDTIAWLEAHCTTPK